MGLADGFRELEEGGFTRLPGVLSTDRRRALADRIEALFLEEGDAAGSEFKQEPGARRLANLVDKDPVFVPCILEPEVLALVGHVLGRPSS